MDNRITYHMNVEGAWDPDVVYGDNKFFVTWEEGTYPSIIPPLQFEQQIRGVFCNKDTGEIIGNRFDITPVEDTAYRYEQLKWIR